MDNWEWEYKIVSDLDITILKSLGLEGWELCAYDSEWRRAFFKRKKKEE